MLQRHKQKYQVRMVGILNFWNETFCLKELKSSNLGGFVSVLPETHYLKVVE